ncbi:MAG: ribosome biogenesis/translation initiation ATPase RLI [Candidatus Aenigmarchaeota archaeon ex4484_52]|nr:MAG: ribosome biogenesis/translation initiation ATPase RLI [Candidatus Aenigmarchaeota archaeon ex4484_52]
MKQIRIAVVNKKKCSPKKCGFECYNFCPKVRAGAKTIIKRENFAEIAEDLCIGCGICVKKCPFGAISIINLQCDIGDVVHQYDKNAFRLYNLPIPRRGEIIGLVGQNAIGKTTTMNIFSGDLIPNIGNFNKNITKEQKYDNIIKIYKASTLHNFFSQLKNNNLTSAYKPQKIDRLMNLFDEKDNVLDLIKKSKTNKNQVIDLLKSIDKNTDNTFLTKKINHLSGGEMQKLSIAITLCKDRDVYFFDEPSMYLDIFVRLSVAEKIKKLKDKNKYCFVVEHDLAIVDYVCDFVHLYFGDQGVYGAISKPYTQNNGINIYLSGYLKDKNIRFRDKSLVFDFTSQKYSSNDILLKYPAFSKKYTGFELKCNKGELNSGEVVGIFGANALGKTTFAKILSGVEKTDSGYLKLKSRISYKTQYLQTDFKGTVIDLINSADIEKKDFLEIAQNLRIRQLNKRIVSTLSGGEMQRLAIAICLCRNADVYLLDEPSAYLDVEERIRLSKIIRNITQLKQKSTLVIDHDIIFLNYTADKAIVFEGKSGSSGLAKSPQNIYSGFNYFLSQLNITFRLDRQTKRPRANKKNSKLDLEQKQRQEYLAIC